MAAATEESKTIGECGAWWCGGRAVGLENYANPKQFGDKLTNIKFQEFVLLIN